MKKLIKRILKEEVSNIVRNNINEGIVEDFIEFGKSELSLGDDFKINLTDNIRLIMNIF